MISHDGVPLVTPDADLRPEFSVIRKIAYSRSRGRHPINLDEFKEALRYLKIKRGVKDVLEEKLGPLPGKASKKNRIEAMKLQDPGNLLSFDHQTSGLIAELAIVWGQFISVYQDLHGESQPQNHIYNRLKQAMMELTKPDVACDIAVTMARHLGAPDKPHPATLLLHSHPDGGARETAKAVAETLADDSGYEIMVLDLAQFRSEGEGASLDGAQSYWAGSRPGLVTRQIYNHPRSVIVFENVDQTLPDIQAALLPALTTGFMVDNYGLDELDRQSKASSQASTTVDCRQAVFIFTASTGAEWYDHPNAAGLLSSRQHQQTAMLEAMAQSRRHYRGQTRDSVHPTLLHKLVTSLVTIEPSTWEERLARTQKQLRVALEHFQRETGWAVSMDEDTIAELATLHLLKHPSLYWSATEHGFIKQNLLDPLCLFLFEQSTPGKARIELDSNAMYSARQWLEQHSADPCRALRQRQLVFDWTWAPTNQEDGLCLQVTHIQTVKAHRLEDYQGNVALTARVPDVRWEDVSGHHDAKTFLDNVAQSMTDPATHAEDLPKGVLLSGPPGTGKTLLAKAFAARCGMPFIAVAGTDLLAPERIDELYSLVHREAPCVIFIDEADALGTRGERSAAHDAALTKLLANVQGFASATSIFHILATNLPEELDPALTRPQRIDHHFNLDALDTEGRRQLLHRHLHYRNGHRLVNDLTKQTHGLTGAQLYQFCRDLRLASPSEPPGQEHIDELLLTMQHGPLDEEQPDGVSRHRIACHEAGHAVVQHVCFPGQKPELISVESRGNQGGITIYGNENTPYETKTTLIDRMAVALAGRAAELEAFGADQLSTGATSDLNRATKLAWYAVCEAGLDEIIGPISVSALPATASTFQDTLQQRVQAWLSRAESKATEILQASKHTHDRLTDALVRQSRLKQAEIELIFCPATTIDHTEARCSLEVDNGVYS
ncbi:MAG: AAA family ATPase [Pseudomonadota bacterium]